MVVAEEGDRHVAGVDTAVVLHVELSLAGALDVHFLAWLVGLAI